jgi:PIN domain nuclease of toxin-antitoxin system
MIWVLDSSAVVFWLLNEQGAARVLTVLSGGDAFGVALAVQRGATFLTTDRGELEKVAAAGVCRIEFLR